jgi:hypothetical protein
VVDSRSSVWMLLTALQRVLLHWRKTLGGFLLSILFQGERSPRPSGVILNAWRALAIIDSNLLNGMPMEEHAAVCSQPFRTVSSICHFSFSSHTVFAIPLN